MITKESQLKEVKEGEAEVRKNMKANYEKFISLSKEEQKEKRSEYLKHKEFSLGVLKEHISERQKLEREILLEKHKKKQERKKKIKKFAKARLEAMAREARRQEARRKSRTPQRRRPQSKPQVRRKKRTIKKQTGFYKPPSFKF